MNTKLIKMINKALGLVYDTVYPMPKVEISQILSKIKTELSKVSEPTEFTKECRKVIKTSDVGEGWARLADYTIWLEVKLERACDVIEQFQAKLKAQQSEKRKY